MSTLKLTTHLGMDGTGFYTGINRAKGAVAGFSNYLSTSVKTQIAAAFGVGAMTAAIKRTIEYADSVEEASNQIGVASDKWQEWVYGAKQAGVSTEKLMGMVDRLNKMAETQQGRDFFEKWGINANQSGAGLFESVWRKANSMPADQARRMLAGIGQKGDTTLLKLFSMSMEEASESARRMGAVLDETSTLRLANLSDQLSVLSQILAANLGPNLLTTADGLQGLHRGAALLTERFATMAGVVGYELRKKPLHEYLTPFSHLLDRGFWGKDMSLLQRGSATLNPFHNLSSTVLDALTKNKDAFDAGDAETFGGWIQQDQNAAQLLRDLQARRAAALGDDLDRSSNSFPQSRSRGVARATGDELIRVGNFLGQGGSVIQTIAQQQLEVARQQVVLLRRIELKLTNTQPDYGVPL